MKTFSRKSYNYEDIIFCSDLDAENLSLDHFGRLVPYHIVVKVLPCDMGKGFFDIVRESEIKVTIYLFDNLEEKDTFLNRKPKSLKDES